MAETRVEAETNSGGQHIPCKASACAVAPPHVHLEQITLQCLLECVDMMEDSVKIS